MQSPLTVKNEAKTHFPAAVICLDHERPSKMRSLLIVKRRRI
jgi:hypothetical protein